MKNILKRLKIGWSYIKYIVIIASGFIIGYLLKGFFISGIKQYRIKEKFKNAKNNIKDSIKSDNDWLNSHPIKRQI